MNKMTEEYMEEKMIAETHLSVDADSVRGTEIGKKELSVLGKKNLMRVYMRDPVRVTDKFSPEVKNSKKEYICFPFRLTLFPHPECNFNYARLMITLEGQKSQILIRDLYPREVNIPYSIDDTLSFKGNLKFGFAELSLASDRKSNIESYYPKIISSGIDNWEAIWQFENLQEDKLHTDGLLFMLVEIEKTAKIFASISLIAKARIGHKLVPLSTRSAGFNNKIQLI